MIKTRLLWALICSTMMLPLAAATFSPTRTDDPAPDGCAPGNCSLREALIAANAADGADVVELAPGQVYLLELGGSNASEESGDLDVRSELTLRGRGAILDGQSTGRLLDVRSDRPVLIENLTLRNANTSLATNGTLNGGGLQVEDTMLTLRDVIFSANRAQTLGGGLYVRRGASVTIEHSAFINNEGSNGGAVHSSSPLILRNVLFASNTANLSGAAAYLTGTDVDYEMRQVTFVANTAANNGGAIYFVGRSLTLDSVFAQDNRTPTDDGGFLSATGTGHVKSMTLRNAIVNSNEARNGGAIFMTDASDLLTVEHASFDGNTATADGGALHVQSGQAQVINATFSGNEAASEGGAIFVRNGSVTLQHITAREGSGQGSVLAVTGSSGSAAVTLANNLFSGDCDISVAGNVTSAGGNLEGPGSSCALTSATDLSGLSSSELGLLPLAESPGATRSYPLAPGSLARDQGDSAVCATVGVDQLYHLRDGACDSGSREAEILFSDSFEVVRPLGSTVTVAL